jgi:hypothetical protein
MLWRLGLEGTVGQRPMQHNSTEVIEDPRADSHHGTEGGISLAGGYPYVELFRQIHEKLCA